MSDSFSTDLDTSAVEVAVDRLLVSLEARCKAADELTATRVVGDARARLRRQLSPAATGRTVSGIGSRYLGGTAYLIFAEREPYPNLPLWLERGTKPGKRKNRASTPAFPFFYTAIEAEAGAHERRVLEAMDQAASDAGLSG